MMTRLSGRAKPPGMAEYQFKPHEQPTMPGSPGFPEHPITRRCAYFLIGIVVATYGGLQNGMLLANLSLLQAEYALTPEEGGWVKAAYYVPYACMSMLLLRVRQHLGIQFFVRLALWALLTANFVQLFVEAFWAEIVARALAAISGSGMISLGIFYLMQSMPAKHRLIGLVLAMGLYQLGLPLARAMSPTLLVSGDITNLFILQFALTLVIMALVNLLPVPPGVRIKVFEKLDLISYPLLAGGCGLLIVVLIQSQIVWWDHAWLGYALAISIAMIGLALLIEHNRANPMLQTRWLSSREIAALALVGAGVRLALSEQNYGAFGFLSMVGMSADQMVDFDWLLVAATLCGTIVSAIRLDMTDLLRPIMIAFGIIAIASFADMHSSIHSRPQDFYVTQAAIAFAATYFIGPTVLQGMVHAMSRGPTYIVSFIAVFSLGQSAGALLGADLLYTFQTFRTKAHLMEIAQRFSLSDPTVAQYISRYAGAYAPGQGDAALSQADAMGATLREATLYAQVQSYNDGFFATGCLAAIVFLAMFIHWTRKRYKQNLARRRELSQASPIRSANG